MIDLHTHSTASDGTTPPARLVQEAHEAGLEVLALTDHDTTSGWDAAAAALPRGLRLVRGAELSCTRDGISLHLLAYLFDPAHPALAQALRRVRDSRLDRAARMVELLAAAGHGVTWDDVQRHAEGAVGRPHVARALVEAGLVASLGEAFGPDWIGTHGRYWAPKEELDALDAIRLVEQAGGVTVFAHPAASSRGPVVDEHVIEEMAHAGLDGIEVDHADHPPEARRHLRSTARALGLLPTGSSDFHGSNKAVRLGQDATAPDVLDELVSRATGGEVLAG